MAADLQPVEDGGLSSDELFMFLTLLVVAGNETTRNALTGGMLAFSLFPDQKEKLLANPDLIDLAVDEIVRYVTPVMSFSRTVTETHEYKGRTLKAGDKVLMLYQSANRDEDVFEAPDEFRIDRNPNPHLGFGIGTHFCLGANLARAEVKTVFTELFARLRDIEIVPGAPARPRRLHARAGAPAPARPCSPRSSGRRRWPPPRPRRRGQRILDAALALMSEHGVSGTSMRELADACELNVATLYHHFPSKADLLRAVVAEQGYLERMRTDEPPRRRRRTLGPPAARLSRPGARGCGRPVVLEEAVWRLLIGESLRGDTPARAEARRPGRTAWTSPSPAGSPRSCPSSPTGPHPWPGWCGRLLFTSSSSTSPSAPTTSAPRSRIATWSRRSSLVHSAARSGATAGCSTSRTVSVELDGPPVLDGIDAAASSTTASPSWPGPSGAGKSTLLRLCNRLEVPTAGRGPVPRRRHRRRSTR